MSDIAPQEQPSRNLEIVRVGEIFTLFDPARGIDAQGRDVEDENKPLGVYQFVRSKFTLQTEETPDIFLQAGAGFTKADKNSALTPFDPAEGFQITGDDYNVQGRVNKLRELGGLESHNNPPQLDTEKNPLWLYISAQKGNLLEEGINPGEFHRRFKPEYFNVVSRLRVLLYFKGLACEGKPDNIPLNQGQLRFQNFYPLDTGQVAVPTQVIYDVSRYPLSEGYRIHLPSDLSKISSIKARIVLMEKPRDTSEEEY